MLEHAGSTRLPIYRERVDLVIFSILSLPILLFAYAFSGMLDLPTEFGIKILLAVVSFALFYLVYQRNEDKQKSWIYFGLFVTTTAFFMDWYFSNWLITILDVELLTAPGIALAKFESMIMLVITVLVLYLLAQRYLIDQTFSDLYIQRGRIRLGLVSGIVFYTFFLAIATVTIGNVFVGGEITLKQFLSWLPWMLLFTFSNSILEEVIYRGILLSNVERYLSKNWSNLLVSILFAVSHIVVTYVNNMIFFLILTFVVSLIFGYVTQKTDSLVGAIIFHAAADISLYLGFVSTL